MSEILGRKDDSPKWQHRAEERKERIQKYLWDPGAQIVLRLQLLYRRAFFLRIHHHLLSACGQVWRLRSRPRNLIRNLGIFEQPGGLAMSCYSTGVQWDYPYGWAPTQIVAIEGLRRYGFNDDANRISYNFLAHHRGELSP